MGIKGLEKLVKESGILEDLNLHGSPMIIDGSSLYYSLYFHLKPHLDQSHGGDYPGFKAVICRFFETLADCNISPCVVLDGGSGPQKQKTREHRLQRKITKAMNIANGESQWIDDILPPLIKEVFKQILIERKIPFVQSFGEADGDIVHFANKFGCPVLSHDSDFYMYDLRGGVISPEPWKFKWMTPRYGFIPAKYYRRSQFCKQMKIDAALIPVLASIAGNDYSRLEDKGKFVERHPPDNPEEPWFLSRLRAILDFLKRLDLSQAETTEQKQHQALTQAIQFVEEEDRERLQRSINTFLESTNTSLRSTTTFLRSVNRFLRPKNRFLRSINTLQRSINECNSRSELIPPPPDLPEWMHEPIRKGRLNTFVIDVICQRQIMLTPLVDDFSQPSSYCAAGRIRQFFYGLLIGQETCIEFDRDGETVRQQEVKPLLPTVSEEDLTNLLRHGPLQASKDFSKIIFLKALNSETLDVGDVSDDMKLPLCVTNFWWKYRQNHENIHHLHALLLWFVCGKDYVSDGAKVRGKIPNPDVAHAFNQWQCCFIASLHLNQLLGRPLPEPDCSRMYHGPVVHQLVDELQGGSSPEQLGLKTQQQQQLFRNYQTKCQGSAAGEKMYHGPVVHQLVDELQGGSSSSPEQLGLKTEQQLLEKMKCCSLEDWQEVKSKKKKRKKDE